MQKALTARLDYIVGGILHVKGTDNRLDYIFEGMLHAKGTDNPSRLHF